jgi:hypothetical protein
MKSALISTLVLALASISAADPSPSVRYLMKEPVTLFDWGIVRLYEYLDGYTTHYLKTNAVQDIYSTVSYDTSRNNILITIVVTREAQQAEEPPGIVRSRCKEICRDITRALRREFLTGRDRHVRRSSGIYRFFGHVGFKGKDEPPDAYDEIEKITLINVSVYSSKDPGRLVLQSESPLMGEDIVFARGK